MPVLHKGFKHVSAYLTTDVQVYFRYALLTIMQLHTPYSAVVDEHGIQLPLNYSGLKERSGRLGYERSVFDF